MKKMNQSKIEKIKSKIKRRQDGPRFEHTVGVMYTAAALAMRYGADMEKAYFNCHTDITIPYDELDKITVIRKDGTTVDIISDGRFVLEGTEELNVPLDK